jgi:hypothetical protein
MTATRRQYDRELILEELRAQEPNDLKQLLASIISKLRKWLRNGYKDLAQDYVHTAIKELCDPDLGPLDLDRDRKLDLGGLFLGRAKRIFLDDLRKAQKEQTLQPLHLEEAALAQQDARHPLSEFAQLYGPANGFPEKKWADFLRKVEGLPRAADQELVYAALQGDCFRIGPARVQINNRRLAEMLCRPVSEVARAIERLKSLFEGLISSTEEGG